MKINLKDIDLNSFDIKTGEIAGNKVFLINPKNFNVQWTPDNLHLRSLMIDSEGNIVSHSFKKFLNVGEKPELYPNPEEYNDWVIESKEDGSLLICDWIFDSFNARTRGTISYKSLANFDDFDYVFKKYPRLIDVCRANPDDSYLMEITSPNQKIVIDYGNEPDIKFLGFIHKPTGLYYPAYSKEGEFIKSQISCKSPEIYMLTGNLSEMAAQVKKWERLEGIIIKYNNNQNFVKAKSDWYNFRHVLKGRLGSINNLIDLFVELKYPTYEEFFKNIQETVDFETATETSNKLKLITDAHKKSLTFEQEIITFLHRYIGDLKFLTRKDAAKRIMEEYKDLAGFAFMKLDNKSWGEKEWRKLLERKINE